MLDKYQQAFVDNIIETISTPNLLTQNILQAVAGSGKSTTVLHSILALTENNIDPHTIIATSFTNLASRELRTRYKDLQLSLGNLNIKYPVTGTLHTVSYSILKKLKPEYKTYSIITEWQSLMLIRDNIMQIFSSDKTNQYQNIKRNYDIESKADLTQLAKLIQETYQHIVNNAKTSHTDLNNKTTHLKDTLMYYIKSNEMLTLASNALQLYIKSKDSLKFLDYDDMILLTVDTLRDSPKLIEQLDYRYIFIDEAQDCNTLQYHLIALLSHKAHLILVGDACQSIYGFRDASPKFFTHKYLFTILRNHQPRSFSLPINYRSTPSIISVSNIVRSITGNQIMAKPHKPTTQNSVKIIKSKNNIAEAKFIAKTIKELVLQGIKPKEITVIARSNRYLKTHIEPALINENIQYRIKGGVSAKKLLDKPVAQFYLDCIQIYLNPNNTYAIINLLQYIKGIGRTNIPQIYDALFNTQLKTGKSVAEISYPKKEVIQPILDQITQSEPLSIPSTIDNIIDTYCLASLQDPKQNEQVNTAISNYIMIYEEQIQYTDNQEQNLTPKDILQGIIQDSSVFNETDNSDEITIATIHSQKGLESRVVFATGFLSLQEKPNEIEEANILYVQLSRAIEKLYILYPEQYQTKDNDTREGYLNPYLQKLITKLNVKS